MLKTDITLGMKYKSEDLKNAISNRLGIDKTEIFDEHLVRRTLDLSVSGEPCYRATVAFSVSAEREAGLLKMRKKVAREEALLFTPPPFSADFRPVVVGAGPAGLFAALTLAESGARPIVLERGLPAEERAKKIKLFESLGILDTECNVQFGEGGAGTYSDGKLKMGARDKYKMKVIDEFISAGATEDIAYSSTAHLGTDRLPSIVSNIRKKIESLGGEVYFGTRLTDIEIREGSLASITYERGGERVTEPCRALLLATGHSARDTVRMLFKSGLKMTPKGFGIGVRIEHPREYINSIVYRESAPEIEESATYHLVTHLTGGRSVYSFCMCPGGSVVAAASEEGGIVTNGMSEHARMADNSNAALLVSVTPSDFPSDTALGGIELQEKIERGAYSLLDSYRAPVTRLSGLFGADIAPVGTLPSYPRGCEPMPLESYLPTFVTEALGAAISDFDAWLPGYAFGDAVLTGPETRTTSPLRIERDPETLEALGAHGVYPVGEGAGYAGGIISSATDGIRVAERLILGS